jgi:hypothetical protein
MARFLRRWAVTVLTAAPGWGIPPPGWGLFLMMKKIGETHMQIFYVDMDNILVGFPLGIARVSTEVQT